jgi:hypothetical protein
MLRRKNDEKVFFLFPLVKIEMRTTETHNSDPRVIFFSFFLCKVQRNKDFSSIYCSPTTILRYSSASSHEHQPHNSTSWNIVIYDSRKTRLSLNSRQQEMTHETEMEYNSISEFQPSVCDVTRKTLSTPIDGAVGATTMKTFLSFFSFFEKKKSFAQ